MHTYFVDLLSVGSVIEMHIYDKNCQIDKDFLYYP